MGMCSRMSSALYSPGLLPLVPSRTCSSPPLVSHLIQCPGYHGVLIIGLDSVQTVTHCGFLLKEDDLLTALLCDLPTFHLFRDSRLLGVTVRPFAPVFRCHGVFLDTREAGICAGSHACFPLLSLLDSSVPEDLC